ncbi:putative response regulator in two-component regulatory system, sigma 54-dependent [Hyphomicrobium sp. GJ21]|jgi:DNA-binding NtrC family response regulator|uniref:sigma-54-dependent transcriptional regulator n=1 Tax=Hyphomicrobium sp. GJ21 TaxID=113574 RepID=UPI000622B577|nr:sigma-54 dependent transcriptional regulator [Hyphomicrobium sp. GJ21]CEJ88311.1 putative response regulator in two-component regulatory system, sigma 54-dependent [Hyphomicrobium sp. GJ21]
MSKRVLIVDDDPAQRRILEETVKRFGFETKTCGSGEQALQILESQERDPIALVILDLVMPGVDGMAVLERVGHAQGMPPIIVQTAHGSIETAINAMRRGAVDFVVKPASPERLEVSIKSALKIEALAGEINRIKKKVEGTLTFGDLVMRGDTMKRVISLGKRAAASTIPVLIEGESGVGKELIARAIQGESERAGRPFITVNCGAIPENLVESILFGHEKGAFTGAVDKRIGKFQEADGGTLFLDEVGELPLDAQVKLLRALQEGEIDPVGSKKPVKVNFRLISATNRDMIQLVKDGKFREDLYYRLNVFPIFVPPLRERIDDVPELARHFAARFAAEEGKRVAAISERAMALLQAYSWPGNVRQLENTIFRAVVLADGPELTVAEFPQIAAHVDGFEAEIPAAPAAVQKQPAYTGPALIGAENTVPHTVEIKSTASGSSLGIQAVAEDGEIRSLEAIEADMIRLALGRYRGHMTEVAKRLNIGRSTLYRKMQEYGLEPRPN